MSRDPNSAQTETLHPPPSEEPVPRRKAPLLITLAIVGVLCFLVLAAGAVWASRGMLVGATVTPTPPPTPTRVSGQPPPGWSLVFDDKFDDNANHWSLIDSDDADNKLRASVEDGTLRWVISANGWMYRKNRPHTNTIISDAYITVDVQVISSQPDDNVTYGILFRAENTDNTYSFQVNDTGNYWIQAHAGESSWIIGAGTTQLVRSHGVNTLGMLAVGPHMTAYINGQPMVEVDDASFQTGRFGVVVFLSEAGQNATIVFDNMKVYTP